MSIFVFAMDYQTFIDSVSNLKDFSLPGKKAHLLTAPLGRKESVNKLPVDFPNARKAAVLLYCYPKKGVMHLSLIKRSTYNGPHSGQISFPGGKPESNDENLWQTALRECKEELGVLPKQTKPLLNLTPLYIPPSNFLVSPFVVIDDFLPSFKENPREVEQHIEIPLHELLRLKVKQTPLDEHLYKGVTVPSYVYQEHIIWGATAMILSEFKVFLEYCALI